MKPATLALSLLLLAPALTAAPWTSGGPYGGVFYSLDASASNPRIVYAAGLYGVFRSDDNGSTWRNVSDGTGTARRLIVVDPVDPATAYAISTGDFRFAYRTTDGGATWTAMNTGTRWTNTLIIDPANPQTLYASADCGFYLEPLFEGSGIVKSTDGGLTWRQAMAGIGAPVVWSSCITGLSLDPANPSHLFARAQFSGAAWESFDGAQTWVLAKEAVPTSEVVIDPYQPSVRYGTNGRTVLRSDDGGVHWTAQPGTGLPSAVDPVLVDLSLDPVTPRIFTATPAGLFRSGDGGRSWVPAGDVPRIRVNSVLFNPVDSTVMIATSQGVFRAPSPAFTPWSQLAVPESGIFIDQIAVDPKRPAIVYASTLDEFTGEPRLNRIFRSSDGGATWLPVSDRFRFRPRMSVDASGDLWFADLSTRTLQRIAGGAGEATAIAREFHDIRSVAAHPRVAGTVYVGSTNGEIWRSGDAGATWNRCQYIPKVINEVALDPNSDAVYVAALGGTFRSMNGCATFEQLDAISSEHVVVAPSNPSVLYRVASGVGRSDDGGTTWKTLPLPLAAGEAREVAVDPDDERRVWFAGDGVWQSNDGGETWRIVSTGLPRSGITALAIDSRGEILHAGVVASGVWEMRVSGRQRSVRRR